MQENGYDVVPDVEFQGWTRFFDRLIGLVFPKFVKEFWIHAKLSNLKVSLSATGNKIIISENLIATLIGHDGIAVKCIDISEKGSDLNKVSQDFLLLDNPPTKSKI